MGFFSWGKPKVKDIVKFRELWQEYQELCGDDHPMRLLMAEAVQGIIRERYYQYGIRFLEERLKHEAEIKELGILQADDYKKREFYEQLRKDVTSRLVAGEIIKNEMSFCDHCPHGCNPYYDPDEGKWT